MRGALFFTAILAIGGPALAQAPKPAIRVVVETQARGDREEELGALVTLIDRGGPRATKIYQQVYPRRGPVEGRTSELDADETKLLRDLAKGLDREPEALIWTDCLLPNRTDKPDPQDILRININTPGETTEYKRSLDWLSGRAGRLAALALELPPAHSECRPPKPF